MAQAPVSTPVTANVTDQLVFVTQGNTAGVAVIIGSDDSIGGGTMSLGVRPQGTDSDAVAYIDATLDAAHNQYYQIGTGMAVYVKLTGATAPSILVIASPVPAGVGNS